MTMIEKSIPPLLIACAYAACLSQLSCQRKNHYGFDSGFDVRQQLAPAESPAEWIERLKLDLVRQSYSQDLLSQLYSELPPMDKWPAVYESIDKIANDGPALEKMMQTSSSWNSPNHIAERLLLFSAMLRDDASDHEIAVRGLVDGSQSVGYRKEETLKALLMVSKNRDATLGWIKENQQSLLGSSSGSSSIREQPKSGWQVALAENRVGEGIALLEAAISAANDSDKPELLQRLLKLGIILGKEPVARKATNDMQALLLKAATSDESISSYAFGGVFDFQATRGEWQEIASFFEKYSAICQKRGDGHKDFGFGQMDAGHATYLTALCRLNKISEFRGMIEKAFEPGDDNGRKFFEMMQHATPGQPPLGILYMDALKVANEDEKTLAYSLNLLARNPGKDAFYSYLIDLSPQRAEEFIKSLHTYDPYEERPLIWLAEIARRAGNLELARETIDQAIALDPSDGDQGKDTRMFCYEVLARIDEDAGLTEKAGFFRSVVDSIRQGEAADDFLHAGLIKEATDRYDKALGQFEDAYCLQSRLAMTLARNGKFEEAVKHFKKAFELMPVSFGPRESHCFGCEGLFDDQRVIDIALPLLEAFEKENPENPRTPYLLGLILSERKEFPQAILAYRRALKLDPDYFNAARNLLALLEKDPENFTAAEELRTEMFKFAPYPEKPNYIPKPNLLRAYWVLTENFPPSPLDLPPLSPGAPPAETAQYVRSKDSYLTHWNYWGKDDALDGWTASELRKRNEFLTILDQIR
ncbi:tetratricopeptide repeat protein [Akkermansiaceae bacterium]|nr:tetratricopeptide repeat protein [Akkermansiaceae bacterium]